MSFAELDKFRIFYESYGAGEPLVLIPGFASGAWTWFRQIDELSKNFQVVVFDPRGIGRSRADGELENLSMKIFARDVLPVLDELKIEKANVLGASFGGFVAQEFALLFPQRLNKLILACTSFGGAKHIAPGAEVLASFAPDPNMTLGRHIRKFLRPAFTAEFNARHADEVEKVCRLREANDVADAVYAAQLQTAFRFDTEHKIGAIENKALVITGDKDNVVPMGNSLNLAKKLPNAELSIIENGSHFFFIEKAEEFNRTVKQFLDS